MKIDKQKISSHRTLLAMVIVLGVVCIYWFTIGKGQRERRHDLYGGHPIANESTHYIELEE